jgi:hypothetical protein
MTTFVRLNTRLYANLLPLYPPDLRRDFGAEMIGVFAEDLADAWQDRGVRGVLRLWCSAALELAHIALPGLLQIPAIAVPLLSFLFSAAMIGAELMLVPDRKGPTIGAVLTAGFITALTSFAAVRTGESAAPQPLELAKCLKSAISPNVSSAPLLWTV